MKAPGEVNKNDKFVENEVTAEIYIPLSQIVKSKFKRCVVYK